MPDLAKRRFPIGRFGAYAAILVVGFTTLWLLCWAFFGDRIAYLGYINAAGLIFGGLSFLSACYLTLCKRWIFAVFALAISVYILVDVSGSNLGASEERPMASDTRIMSASLRGLNQEMQQSAAHLAAYDADIIGLQEVYDPAQFKQALEKVTGKIWYMAVENKLAILAKYPVEKTILTNKNILSAQVTLPSRTITVWTLHAPKVFARPLVNHQFFRELQGEISEKKPDAVIGDFNASPWNDGYAIMAKSMKNAHKLAGFGPGSTFPTSGRRSGFLGAFARIDHIFVRPGLSISNAYTGMAYKLSDHHPVIADVNLP